MRITLVIAAALLAASPALAINKCIGKDGRAVFQDAPCQDGRGVEIVVKPARGSAPAAQSAAHGLPANAAAPLTEAQRNEALADRYQAENRVSSLEVRVIPDARARVSAQKTRCDSEFATLRNRKASASNNLAGATWEHSISAEMGAVATRCDTEGRVLHADLERFLKELAGLKERLKRP